jgi:hypothetical protein
MIVLKDKYDGVFLHSLSQEHLGIIKEQIPNIFDKYFIEE